MARNQDKRGFFQRACGRFVLIVSAVALAAIGIAVLVLAGQASEKLDFHVPYRGNSSAARLQIGSASCDPPFNVTITPIVSDDVEYKRLPALQVRPRGVACGTPPLSL